MHNIYDIISRCNQKLFYLTHNYKLGMRNAIFKVIDQHKNASCPMQSFEKDCNLNSIGSLYHVLTPKSNLAP